MTCRTFNEFLIDYRSGDLTPDERARFEAHLVQCSPCVTFLKSYEATIQLAKGAFHHPDNALPADVANELVRAICAARPRVRR